MHPRLHPASALLAAVVVASAGPAAAAPQPAGGADATPAAPPAGGADAPAPVPANGAAQTAGGMAIGPAATAASADDSAAARKALGRLVGAIRLSRVDLAARELDFPGMTERILGPTWATLSAAQRTQAAADVGTIVRSLASKQGRKKVGFIDAITYGAAIRQADGSLRLSSTAVVHRDYKKVEMAIEWLLRRDQGRWRVVDTVTAGESTTAAVYAEEVAPLLAKGGVDALLATLHRKAQDHQG